ncbi:MAG: hypothetical protein QOG44_2097 [Acidimicrobiaceae bacterium]|nr:hypothetical protein [Acidimicrobiaceae bacterium]
MGPKVLKIVVAIAAFGLPLLAWTTPAQADAPSDIVALVNNLRATVSAAPLAADATLTSVAQQWANHMASTGVLSHNPNLASQAPSGWTKIGENIGDGYSLSAVYNSLVASPDHFANMVDKAFNRTGVGVATDSKGQVWLAEAFGAYPPPPAASLVFPTSGTVIFPSAQPFSWQQVAGGQYYCLTVGTSQGGVDLVNSGLLPANQLSYTVPALPGGQQLWARVYTYVQSTWTWTDVKFSVTGPSMATFTRPTAGATNVDTTQPFTWSPVTSAGYYGITVGTTAGGYDLVNTGPLPASQTSLAVPALPAGRTLWARVYSYIAGSWAHYSDVSFTAAAR